MTDSLPDGKEDTNRMVSAEELSYEDLTEDDAEAVVQFMKENFYPREPLSTGLHMTYEDSQEWIPCTVRVWVRNGVSVVARDPETGEIAGTCLATVLTKDNSTSFDGALESPKLKVKTLHAVLSNLEEAVDLFDHFTVVKILELAMITVSANYGGKGVGKRLVLESESRGVQQGCQVATAQATAVPSQKLLERIGYETLYELDYESFTVAGEKVFDMDRTLGTPSAKVMAKVLAERE